MEILENLISQTTESLVEKNQINYLDFMKSWKVFFVAKLYDDKDLIYDLGNAILKVKTIYEKEQAIGENLISQMIENLEKSKQINYLDFMKFGRALFVTKSYDNEKLTYDLINNILNSEIIDQDIWSVERKNHISNSSVIIEVINEKNSLVKERNIA